MNGIEAMYGYSVKSQQDILRRLWTKKTNDVKKNTGNIKSSLPLLASNRQVTS